MEKKAYILFLICSILFISCSNHKDEDDTPPVPLVDLTEDALIGTWETYYFEKQVVINPNKPNASFFGGLRYIDYDGFKTTFLKEGNKYKALDYNLAGFLIFEAEYYIKDDTIKFERHLKAEDGRDSIAISWQRVREFSPSKGILMLDHSYYGVSSMDGSKYKITDAKITRNTKTAPTTTEGLAKPKVMVDYDDLCRGIWNVDVFKYYEDGDLDEAYSDAQTKLLQNKVSFDFFIDSDGDKMCKMREWSNSQNKWAERDYPVVLVDDVIHLISMDPAFDDEGNPVYDEQGNRVYEDNSFYLWVTSWKERDGVDSFIDFKESRFEENLRVVVKTQIYMKRILDA